MIKYMIENDIRYDKQRLGKLIEKRKIASTWHSKEWLHYHMTQIVYSDIW